MLGAVRGIALGALAMLAAAVPGSAANGRLSAPAEDVVAGFRTQASPPAAQPQAPVAEAAATAVPVPPAPASIDLAVIESALRYYASQKQTARVEAEIRRLKHFHPGWTVPADLYTARTGTADEAPLWKLFGEDKVDEMRAAIAARIAADPNWRPSDDLGLKLRRKEARIKILQACGAKRWRAAIDIVEADIGAVDPEDVLLKWSIADAYGRIQKTNKAFEVLYSILATSREPAQRIGTAQKAIALLPMTDADKLIAMARVSPDGRSEFEPIAPDIARARISAFLHDEPAQAVAPLELSKLEEAARAADDPNQAGLLAWYRYKRSEPQEALEWFKASLGRGGDAMIAHGLAHALRRLGKTREAEEVSYAWREPLTNNQILYIDILERELTAKDPPFVEPTRLARYAEVTMRSQSGEGAQALAWYAYNSCQYDTALDWFQRAVAWLPKEATVYGYALTLQRLKRRKEFFEVISRYDGLFPSVVALEFPDGRRYPPSRCDRKGPPERPVVATTSVTSETYGHGLRLMGEPPAVAEVPERGSRENGTRRATLAIVPKPGALDADPSAARMPVLRRDEFPLAVRPENNLRFAAETGAPQGRPRAGEGLYAPEPAGAMPLAARRVPGVGAMPYERYGYTLMPGWNGIQEATDPPAADQAPAVGTTWADEQNGPTASTPAPDGARAGQGVATSAARNAR